MIRYQITSGLYAANPDAWFRKLRTDVDFIQIRERDLPVRELAALVRQVIQTTSVPILVNDRIDVAIACGAAGVHLRAGSVSPLRVKQLAPLLVSVACHNEDDLKHSEGADLAVLAPVFSPISKPDNRPTLGLDTLRRLATASSVPLLALGGITEENAAHCMRAGAAGIAGISLWENQ